MVEVGPVVEKLRRALGLSVEEDPLRKEIKEMKRMAREAERLARVERRKPKKTVFESALPEELFSEELVERD